MKGSNVLVVNQETMCEICQEWLKAHLLRTAGNGELVVSKVTKSVGDYRIAFEEKPSKPKGPATKAK